MRDAANAERENAAHCRVVGTGPLDVSLAPLIGEETTDLGKCLLSLLIDLGQQLFNLGPLPFIQVEVAQYVRLAQQMQMFRGLENREIGNDLLHSQLRFT